MPADLPTPLEAQIRERAKRLGLSEADYLQSLLDRDQCRVSPEVAPQWRAFMEQTGDLAFLKDMSGRFTLVNQAIADRLGCSPDEVVGKRAEDYLEPESARRVEQLHREVIAGGKSITREMALTRQGHPQRFYSITEFPYGPAGQAPCGVAGFWREITEWKQAESALRELAQGLSATTGSCFFSSIASYLASTLEVDAVMIGEVVEPDQNRVRTVTMVMHGQITTALEYDLRGTPCENVVGKTLCAYPSGVQHLFPNDQELRELGIESYLGTPLFDLDGQALGLIAVMHSRALANLSAAESLLQIVAKRVEAELIRARADQQMKQLTQKLELILRSAGDGILVIDRDGRTALMNPAAVRMLGGVEGGSLIGRPAAEVFGALKAERLETGELHPVEAVLRTGKTLQRTGEMKAGSDGKPFPIRWIATPILQEGAIVGAVLTFNDIGAIKRAEAAIAHQAAELQKAQELDRLKSSFVDSVTHELRTPLTSIVGFAEFLEDCVGGDLSPEQHNYVQQIQKGAQRLEYLLDDLLDFARLEAGTFRLVLREADLNQKASEIVASMRPQAQEHDLALTLELPPEPVVRRADPLRIGQVLANMISNAIKFTPPGGRIDVRLRDTGQGLRVEVQDTGIGITAEDLPKLFHRFTQLEDGKRIGAGTGLGLSISKSIIEAHAGAIGVDSDHGAGSTFWFTLPA